MENVETIWSPFIITNSGLKMRQRVMSSGEKITFNYAKIGEGAPDQPSYVSLMTDIISFSQQVDIVRSETKGATHYIGVRIDNRTFKEPVLMTEIGVFASIGSSAPVLYGYTYTTQGYDSIPSTDVSHYVWTIGIDTVLSRSHDISFSYDGSNLYVTYEDFNVHTHSVMTGATGNLDGKSGFVPKPLVGEQKKFLRADGTWQHTLDVHPFAERIRDKNKPDYGFEGSGEYRLMIETGEYTGTAEVAIIREDNTLLDAKNITRNTISAPEGTFIITEE